MGHLHLDPALLGEFHCIAEQVQQNLAKSHRIGDELRLSFGVCRQAQGQAFCLGGRADEFEACRGDRVRVHFGCLQRDMFGFDLGHIEHTGYHFQKMLSGLQHGVDAGALGGAEAAFHVEQLRVAEDTVEGGAQFVAHSGEETGLCPVRLLGSVAGLAEVAGHAFQAAIGFFQFTLARGERFAGVDDFGDVLLRSDNAWRAAIGLGEDFGAQVDPTQRSVGAVEAELRGETAAAADQVVSLFGHPGPVVGMDPGQPVLGCHMGLVRGEAVHRVHFG